MAEASFKVTVNFEERPGGGLRVWSDDVPGLVLSGADVDGVLEDVVSAMRIILSHQMQRDVQVSPLGSIKDMLASSGMIPRLTPSAGAKELVVQLH